MFVQIIDLQVPPGQVKEARRLVADEYLPALQDRNGFISAHLLEQVDDRDYLKLVIYWDEQKSVEEANRTGVLAGSTTSIAARIPGMRVQRQSYITKVFVERQDTSV